jgi:hypothetical protein
VPLLEKSCSRPLLILAKDIEGKAQATPVGNKLRGRLTSASCSIVTMLTEASTPLPANIRISSRQR